MKPFHSVTHGGSKAVIRKGPIQPVLMTVMQRMGNKKVTLVENLEFYGIMAEKVAHTAQKLAAASTTVESTPGSSKVLVQGNAVNIISKLLQDEYGLPSKYIDVVDKLKQSRKKGGKR
jgi:translation initiation factor 2D